MKALDTIKVDGFPGYGQVRGYASRDRFDPSRDEVFVLFDLFPVRVPVSRCELIYRAGR